MRHPVLERIEEVVHLVLRGRDVVRDQLQDLALAPVAEVLGGGECQVGTGYGWGWEGQHDVKETGNF